MRVTHGQGPVPGARGADGAEETAAARQPGAAAAEAGGAAADRIEISDAARGLQARSGTTAATVSSADTERLESVRRRIESGDYAARQVQEAVAARLLEALGLRADDAS